MHKYIILLSSLLLLCSCQFGKKNKTSIATLPQPECISEKFNADSAYQYIVDQCAFGARVPNSTPHEQCLQYIVKQFKRCGLQVIEQKANLKAWDGKELHSTNIIASYLPKAKKRIVIAAHWDSRPWCDADTDTTRHHEPVLAANDGASGIAVMIELARQMHLYNDTLGIDFVCFDSEDYGAPYWGKIKTEDSSDWCLGSRYWAQNLPKGYKPLYGILLDMVGAPDSRFKLEYYSMHYAQNIIAKVWAAADIVGANDYFVMENGGAITDDHVEMNRYGKIPTIDVIGTIDNTFPPTWHTVNDTPEHISKETLYAVGQTLMQVVYDELP